jgi:hypothetical protein
LLRDLKKQRPDGTIPDGKTNDQRFENWIMEYTNPISKLRCGDRVDQDIRLLRERNWKNLALNREECRKLLKKARAHTGLLSQ